MNDDISYISLYRRYRPQRFSEVVGQEEVTRTLRNAVIAGQVAHAYLFSGERGIGKTSIARILARAVNCLHPEGGEPCNACANCKAILANRTLDILEIDGASNRGIDHIRRLREEVAFSPTDLKTKVYIIDEVHMLTNEAFNALLKTLEEPPPHVVFIFATTEPHKVPRTILSRCQAFDFRKIPQEKIAARLRKIAQQEGIPIEDPALELIARKANGGMRDAIVMLEQAASFRQEEGKITTASLLDMLGLVGREEHAAFLDAIESGDRRAVLELIDSLVDRGKDLEVFLGDLIEALRDRIASGGSADEGRDIALVRGLLDIKQELYRSLDRRIVLEIGVLSLMQEISPRGPAKEEPRPALEKNPGPPAAPPLTAAARDETPSATQEEEEPAPPAADGSLESRWEGMLRKIEQERIAIAAFLTEGTPRIEGNKLHIVFHPECTFHKESLEKSDNMQYLAGMVHRYLGDEFVVEVEFDDNAVRKPSPREALRAKARLLCEVFDGKVVKED